MRSRIFIPLDTPLAENQSLEASFEGHHYFVLRHQGALVAYLNRCPHLGIPLNWQPNSFFDSDAELLQCATHGALFLPTSGECIHGPCNGDFLSKVTVSEAHDGLYLWPDTPAQADSTGNAAPQVNPRGDT